MAGLLSDISKTLKVSTKAPRFEIVKKQPRPTGESGGVFTLCLDGQKLCDYVGWGFASCSVALLENFKAYVRDYTNSKNTKSNWELLTENQEALFEFLNCTGCDNWLPREYLMVLSPMQIRSFQSAGKFLEHPCIKEVDHWTNKSHGGNRISLYRISLQKDFK
jgi:hypothetical protein